MRCCARNSRGWCTAGFPASARDGPRGGNPGYDAIIQAMTGMIAATGSPQSGPTRIGVPLVDITTGLYAAIGILMALSERQQSGLGQFLETTLYETGLAIMHPHAANYFMHGKPPQLTGNEHPNLVPYAIFPTRTDNIFIGVGNDGTFRKLCKEIGKPELGADPRFARNKDRIANREALRTELASVFSQHEAGPLCDRLLAAGLPAGPVQSIDQALASAHTRPSRRYHREGLVQGSRLADPAAAQQAGPASFAAEIQPARRGSAVGIRIFQRRDRSPGRRGRGMRPERKRSGRAPIERPDELTIRRAARLRLFSTSLARRFPRTIRPLYAVIRTSSGAANAPNEDDGPTGGDLMAFRPFGAAGGSRGCARTGDAGSRGDGDPVVARDDRRRTTTSSSSSPTTSTPRRASTRSFRPTRAATPTR